MRFLAASVSISSNLLMESWKYDTPAMTPKNKAKSLYCSNLSVLLSTVGGSNQYLALVYVLSKKPALLAAGLVDSLKFLRSIIILPQLFFD